MGRHGAVRSKQVRMPTADVVVIGGGVTGVAIAHALAARGVRRVLLLEKDALASGASGRSSALIRMHYTNEWDARLAHASFPTFRDWPEVIGGPGVFTRTGFLNIVAPPYADRLRRNVQMLCGLGIETSVLTPEDVSELQPALRVDDVGAAAYEPSSGYVSPVDVVAGLRRRAEALGARVREWTPVTAIRRAGDTVTGVLTPAGEVSAGAIVVAAGAWAPRLCRDAGVELPARVKGVDTVVVTRPPALDEPHLTVVDNVLGTYFRPESRVLTIVGVPCQAWDLDPDAAAAALPPSAVPEAARLLTHRMPAMENAALARGFRAFDCYSTDRHAILDAVPDLANLYVATAFSGAGFKIAPAVGTCMAELILDGQATTVDIRPFGLRRFAEGRPLEGPYPYAPRRDHLEPGVPSSAEMPRVGP
jgi:sarcosine oxidase subunit beta